MWWATGWSATGETAATGAGSSSLRVGFLRFTVVVITETSRVSITLASQIPVPSTRPSVPPRRSGRFLPLIDLPAGCLTAAAATAAAAMVVAIAVSVAAAIVVAVAVAVAIAVAAPAIPPGRPAPFVTCEDPNGNTSCKRFARVTTRRRPLDIDHRRVILGYIHNLRTRRLNYDG